MLHPVEFTSEVPQYVTTGDEGPEGYEVRVTEVAAHPFFSLAGIMRFLIHESDGEDGYCGDRVWVIPVPDLSAIRSFTVQEHFEDGAKLLVLSVYNEGNAFEEPEIAIEIDRAIMHG